MRTIEDLRAVFADLADTAPRRLSDASAVLAAPRHRARWLVAAVAVTAVVVAVIVWPRAAHRTPAPAGPGPVSCPRNEHCPLLDKDGKPVPMPSHYSLGVRAGSGWSVLSRSIDPRAEQMQFTKEPHGQVVVTRYGPHASAPVMRTTDAAEVPGHDASYVHVRGLAGPAIAWADATGTTVVQVSVGDDDGDLLPAARAVVTTDVPIRLPFRFTSLPAGLVPESLLVVLTPGGGFADLGFTDGRPTQGQWDPPGDHGPAVEVSAAMTDYRAEGPRLGTTVDGTAIYATEALTGGYVYVIAGVTVISANQARGDAYPQRYLLALAERMTLVAQPTDPTTWFGSDLFDR